MLIPKIVGWYKMNTAKQINAKLNRTGTPFWQRNYYEHIIRNEESLHRIRQYIKENPKRWAEDRLYLEIIRENQSISKSKELKKCRL